MCLRPFWLGGFLLSLLFFSHLHAQEYIGLPHQPALTLERALGGITPAQIANDIALGFASPALLGKEHDRQLSLSYSHLSGSSHLGNVFYGQAWGERGAWGTGIRFLSHGQLQSYDRLGNHTGSFTGTEALVQGSYSYELTDQLRAGISFYGLYTAIESYASWGIGTDLGINYYNSEHELSLGLSLVHLGQLFQNHERGGHALPWDIQFGFSQRLAHAPFQVSLSIYDLHPKRRNVYQVDRKFLEKLLRHLTLGITFLPSERIWIALGYSPKVAQDVHLLRGYHWAGISGGIGFEAPHYRFSLACSALDPGVWVPQISFGIDLGMGSRL